MSSLSDSIKRHEGFRGDPYDDHLGYPTIGYGTKLPITEQEAEFILKHRLMRMVEEINDKQYVMTKMPSNAKDIIYEMCYQMGVEGVMKFKNMWRALDNMDFELAAKEMMDSKWASQTPHRALELSTRMNEIK